MKITLLLSRFGRQRGNRGIAVVYVALMLVVLLAFVGLAIDIGYMYVAKTQLQNAADAAALAGSGKFTQAGVNDLMQNAARSEAIAFAANNKSTGVSIAILNDSTNILSDNNDITVGHWNGTVYNPGQTPVNAIQVRTRRTENSPGGQIKIFFGRVLGWDQMSAAAVAVAGRAQRADAPISLCIRACGPTDGVPVDYPGGRLFYLAPYPDEALPDGSQGIAWTSFSDTSQSMDKELIINSFCGGKVETCGKTIYSNNSNDNELARQFRCAFKNPDYESNEKTCSDNITGTCGPGAGRTVASWVITVPVFVEAGCPPGSQPNPYTVVKYARIRVTEVYASGGGGTNKCACSAYDAPTQGGSNPNAIVIDQITCVQCNDPSTLGNSPILVK